MQHVRPHVLDEGTSMTASALAPWGSMTALALPLAAAQVLARGLVSEDRDRHLGHGIGQVMARQLALAPAGDVLVPASLTQARVQGPAQAPRAWVQR